MFAKNLYLFVFVFFSFSAPPFSVGETSNVASKRYEIKNRIYFFLVNTKYISSHELKTSNFSLTYEFQIWCVNASLDVGVSLIILGHYDIDL